MKNLLLHFHGTMESGSYDQKYNNKEKGVYLRGAKTHLFWVSVLRGCALILKRISQFM